MMEFLDLAPLTRAQGTVQLPGSKSISNRILLLSALAQGTTEVKGLLDSDDTPRDAGRRLPRLGVQLDPPGRHAGLLSYRVWAGRFRSSRPTLLLGNAGTAFRSLTAALALSGGDYS